MISRSAAAASSSTARAPGLQRPSPAAPRPAQASVGRPAAELGLRHAVRRCTGRQPGRSAESRVAAAAAAQSAEAEAESQLQSFLRWLIANGVEGVGAAGSKVALYEGEAGERGVACLAPIAVGEVAMRVPLRLAITDQLDEGDSSSSAEAEQPWSVRLAGRLLRLAAQGGACPWAPYLAVLPQAVPSPLTAFSWEDVQAVEYPPMLRQLEHALWLASSAGAADGGAFSRAQWDWALSVVHSRTFGAPGPAGGVGVRMLVPLVDMLNHAGDSVTSVPGAAAPAPAVQAFENVRWDLRAPAGPEGEWAMEVKATRDIAAGEELLLSYGERGNDDFFLHYGFVPPRNPHDDVALFTDIESAVDWWLDAFLPLGALPPARLQAAINSAYTAAEEQDGTALAAESVLQAVPEAEAEVLRAELARIKLSAGGMVDGRLMAAFRALYETAAADSALPLPGLGASWAKHLRAAVARRCQQILASMPTPLLADLEQLAAWEQRTGQVQHCWAAAQQHYSAAVAAHEAQHGSLLGPAAAAAVAPGGEAAEAAGSGGSDSSPPLLDAGALSGADAALAQMLLQQAPAAAQQQDEAAAGGDGESGGSMLPVLYRCCKKIILADAILLAAGS